MSTYHWKVTLSDTETIAIERALWLLINQDIPGKDAALEEAARSILGKLPLEPVRAEAAAEPAAAERSATS
jgi:hypothetical protein